MRAADRFPSLFALLLACSGVPLVSPAAQEPAMSTARPADAFAVAETPVLLQSRAVTVPLVPLNEARALEKRLAALAPDCEIHLVIDGLRVDADPGTLYRVELVAADSAAVESVGSFNVFGVAHAEGATAQRSFVVTAALRRLAGSGVAVRIVPDAAAAAGAQVSVARISLVAQ